MDVAPSCLNGISFSPGHQTKTAHTATAGPVSSTQGSGSVKCVERQTARQSHITHTLTPPLPTSQSVPEEEEWRDRFCNGLLGLGTTSKATGRSPRQNFLMPDTVNCIKREARSHSMVNNYKYHRDLSNRVELPANQRVKFRGFLIIFLISHAQCYCIVPTFVYSMIMKIRTI